MRSTLNPSFNRNAGQCPSRAAIETPACGCYTRLPPGLMQCSGQPPSVRAGIPRWHPEVPISDGRQLGASWLPMVIPQRRMTKRLSLYPSVTSPRRPPSCQGVRKCDRSWQALDTKWILFLGSSWDPVPG